jgi:ubiquinone/menaquinone biosynthesis C-methylase UbiE
MQNDVIHAYRKRAKRYDTVVKLLNLFSSFGFNIEGWRREAIQALNLKRGDTVVDIGCGTGLNFRLLQEAIGPEGQIIGVDLSEAMLAEARERAEEQGWKNIVLRQGDAAQFEVPANVGGILSTFALILIPEREKVVRKGCEALAIGRQWVVLDMAWPQGWPLWWRHVLFFLRSYGVTGEVLKGRPWERVWNTMEHCLTGVSRKQFWMGFFYLTSGIRDLRPHYGGII